jgi:hypothetical protein
LLLIVGCAQVWAKAGAEPVSRIPAQQLQADFAIFKKAYEELHPGLYRYNTKAQMDANFSELQGEFKRDLTLQEAYMAFSVFLAKIKCGHSYPNFFNQPETVVNALFQHQDRVPFYFRWLDRRMIITRNFSGDERLNAGTEVLSINGTPVDQILARLMTIARADGSNDAKRVSYLEVSGDSRFEAFDIYFPMFFPQTNTNMKLRVKSPTTGLISVLSAVALTCEQRLAPIKSEDENQHGGNTALWQLEFLDEHTAYLKMKTWAMFNSKWDWKAFLDRAFDEIAKRKATTLVIDLRGNEGGNSVGDVIVGKLARQDVQVGQIRRLVRYKKVPDDLVAYLDTWDPSFKDWGSDAVDPSEGYYRLKKYDDEEGGEVIRASEHPFTGKTYVLVNAANSSATFEFAETMQQNKLGTLVGQPTGGNQRGINGGAFFFLRLPNSKVEIDLPLIGSFPSGERPDAGLQPDIFVQPRATDIARGVDTEMNAIKLHMK